MLAEYNYIWHSDYDLYLASAIISHNPVTVHLIAFRLNCIVVLKPLMKMRKSAKKAQPHIHIANGP